MTILKRILREAGSSLYVISDRIELQTAEPTEMKLRGQ
jgi:hypothetical protein